MSDQLWPPRLISFVGPSGAGKTTLAGELTARLARAEVPVEYVPEDHLFLDPRFAALAERFRTKVFPSADELLEHWSTLVALPSSRWIVNDGSWVHLAEDLPWAQGSRDALVDYTRRLYAIAAPLRPLTIALRVPTETAVARAAARSGEAWMVNEERYLEALPALAGTPATATALVEAWVERVRGVLLDAEVPITEIDVAGGAADVADAAWSRVLAG